MADTENRAMPPIREIELRLLERHENQAALDRGSSTRSQLQELSSSIGRSIFLVTFVLPVTIAGIYLFLVASDRYIAEAKFLIRSAGSTGAMIGLEAAVNSHGLTRAADETFAVNEYIMSRDAMRLLIDQKDLRGVFSRPESDFINRFPNFYTEDNLEEMFRYYKRMINAYVDGATSISTLEVVAFRPEDARNLAASLLQYAEELINKLNERAHQDARGYADALVERAQQDVSRAQALLTEFRHRSGMVDISREANQALDSIARLSDEVAQIEAALEQQRTLTPNSPAINSLSQKARSLRDEMSRELSLVVGRESSMATKLGQFEKLVLEREIATKALASAENSREQARQEAERQHLYLQVIVEPNLPDQAKYPRRLLYFAAICLASFFAFISCRALATSALEHA